MSGTVEILTKKSKEGDTSRHQTFREAYANQDNLLLALCL